MKQSVWLGLASIAILAGLGVTGITAHADDISATTSQTTAGTSKATFNVEDGDLSIGKIDSDTAFDFGTYKLSDFGKNPKLALKSTTLPDISVTNYNTTVSGWTLTAKADPFKSTDGNVTLANVVFNLGLTGATTKESNLDGAADTYTGADTDKAAKTTSARDIMGDGATVLSGSPALGVSTASVDSSATNLDISGVGLAQLAGAKNYQSTVTWTLNQTPTAAAAE
jgi:hypothetical protein